MSSLLNKAVHNSIFTGFGTLANLALGFLFAGFTIRFLGEARAGYLLTLQALVGLNALLGGFGLGTPAIRRVACLASEGQMKSARQLVGSVLTLNISTALIPAVLIVVFFTSIFAWSQLDPLFHRDAFWATLLAVASFLVTQCSSSWQLTFQSLQRYDLVSAASAAFGLLTGISGIAVLSIYPTMTALAAAQFLICILRIGYDAYFAGRLLHGIPIPAWHWHELRSMVGFGGWAYLGTLGRFLFTNVDRLVLTAFLGSASLPYYAIAQRLYSQLHGMLVSQWQFLFPMFSSSGEGTAGDYEKLEDRLRWFVGLVSAGAYILALFIAPAILTRVVGIEFVQKSMLPIELACIQGYFHAQMIVPYFGSWGAGHAAPNTIAQLVNGSMVIVTAVLLIPYWGYVGASLAQLWICPVFLGHTIWIRKILLPHAPHGDWLKSYITPMLMIAIWLIAIRAVMMFFPYDSSQFYLLLVLAGAPALLAVWLVECRFFSRYQRWSTLTRSAMIPLSALRVWLQAK